MTALDANRGRVELDPFAEAAFDMSLAGRLVAIKEAERAEAKAKLDASIAEAAKRKRLGKIMETHWTRLREYLQQANDTVNSLFGSTAGVEFALQVEDAETGLKPTSHAKLTVTISRGEKKLKAIIFLTETEAWIARGGRVVKAEALIARGPSVSFEGDDTDYAPLLEELDNRIVSFFKESTQKFIGQ